MSNQKNVPTNISYTDDEIAKASSRPTLNPGWYRFLIRNAENTVSENKGHIMTNITLAPLTDPDDAATFSSPTIRHNIVWPFKNPEYDGHKAPNTTGICHNFLRAVLPDEIHDYPRKVDRVLTYKGEAIPSDEEASCRMEVTRSVFEYGKKVLGDPEVLNDNVVYAEVYQNGEYLNARNFRAELPEEAVLVSPEDFSSAK